MVAMSERAMKTTEAAGVGLILHIDGQNVIMINIIINGMDSQSLCRGDRVGGLMTICYFNRYTYC